MPTPPRARVRPALTAGCWWRPASTRHRAARVVREIAGHSDIKVTMTVCAHGHLEETAAALAQLSTAVAGTLPSPVAVNPPIESEQDS